jgi:hypothetical protein
VLDIDDLQRYVAFEYIVDVFPEDAGIFHGDVRDTE